MSLTKCEMDVLESFRASRVALWSQHLERLAGHPRLQPVAQDMLTSWRDLDLPTLLLWCPGLLNLLREYRGETVGALSFSFREFLDSRQGGPQCD